MKFEYMLEESFIEAVKRDKLFDANDCLFIGVSGGVDSVVLSDLCYRSKFNISLAHVNFGLRGEESDADEQFVRMLAHRFNVPLFVHRVDARTHAEKNKLSIQVAAREMRYKWFEQLITEHHAKLLTAHHADDNVETMLMHFFRGTGIHGLRGIPQKSGRMVRPLLNFTKKELVNYATERNLEWRDDSSNASDKYSRNYFRNAIIPGILKIFPEAESNLIENTRRFAEAEELYKQALQLHLRKLLTIKGNETHIPVLKLKKLSPLKTIMYEIISSYGFSASQLDDVLYLLDAPHGKMAYSATHRVIRNRDWLIIAPRISEGAAHIIIEPHEKSVSFEDGQLEFEIEGTQKITNSTFQAFLDKNRVVYPLILRKWKEGDYFYPLGMPKKKKIARFLIDKKLSKTEKEKVWVLESDKRICWVVGLRIDERFKAKEGGDTIKVSVIYHDLK